MRDEYYEIQKIGIVSSKLISRRSISKFLSILLLINIVQSVKSYPHPPPAPKEYKEGSMEGAKLNTEKHMYIMKSLKGFYSVIVGF